MSIAAHDGPSDGPHGRFSRGSIKLRPLPVSLWLLPRGEQECCATWSSVKAAPRSSGQYCFTGLVGNEIPDVRVPWEGLFCHPFIHGHSFRFPLWASLSYSQQHATSRGENDSCEQEICFSQLSSTWELFENNNAGNALFWFCIRWTGKNLATFFAYNAPWQRKLFKMTIRVICYACAKSGLGNECSLLKTGRNEAWNPMCVGTTHSVLVLTVSTNPVLSPAGLPVDR